MRPSILCFSLILLANSLTFAAIPKDLKAAITSLQKTYDSTRDFSATFKQNYHHKVLNKNDESQGVVLFKKPGQMRWDYEKPSVKSFIVDGKSLWVYQKNDNLAFRDKCFKQDGLTASIAFLWGQGKVLDLFDPSWFQGQFGDAKDLHIALVPKKKNSVFKKLILVVDPKTHRAKQSIVVDLEGNVNQFTFSDLRFNQKLDGKKFHFTPPKGTHVSPLPGSCT
jgi:outer membrane lipoprotein carrier protein